MKKILTALLCLLLVSPAITRAQCNAQLSWMAAPAQNNLLQVDFYNTSGAPPPQSYTTTSITFGDGSPMQYISTGTTHNYATPGTYTAKLYLYSYDSMTQVISCLDTAVQQVTVSYPACGATISSVNNGSGSYTFTASNPAGTAGLSYSWNFGDGNTGSGAVVSHTYSNPGYYNVTLNVTGTGCNYGNETYVSTMANGLACDSLQADFTYSVSGNYAAFTNTAPAPPYFPTLGLFRYATWIYGDGSSYGSGNYSSHSYAAAGTYTVTMINQYIDSMSQAVHCADTVSHQVTVGNPIQQNYISGTIYFDSLNVNINFSDSLKVWLIAHDTAANTLTAIDSITTTFLYPYYTFYGHSAGDYLVKAALMGQPAGTTGLVPTYHYSSLYWSGASTILHSGGITAGKDVLMQTGTITSGPGFIGGNISMGAGRGTGTGVAQMLVFLRNSNNNEVVAFTYTNDEGDYTFEHIPAGNYNIYPEAINYSTTPSAILQVQAGDLTRNGIDFEQFDDNIRPKGTVGIHEKEELSPVDVYPNPARDAVFIKTFDDQYNKATLVNTLGQVIATQTLHKGINSISTTSLAPGMYYLMLNGKNISRSVKITRQ